jgi:hypothetical protein
MLGGDKEQIEDWRDEVVHYYSVGNMMYELYISPDILTGAEMDVLGNTTKWAMANAHPLLDNSTMVLGDPAQREPYGYVHSTAEKSIVTLRNPFVRPRTVKLKLDELNGFAKLEGPQVLEIQYPYRKIASSAAKFGDTLTFDLGSYEQIVFELYPAAANQSRIEGVRFSVDGSAVHTYAPAGAGELTFSPVALRTEGAAGEARTVHLSTTVQVPSDYRQALFAVLLEPDQENRGVKADGTDFGQPLLLSTENGNRGVWHWFYANLPPGKHAVDLTVHIPASPGGARISAWLLTRRALAAAIYSPMRDNERLPSPSLLPAESNIERATYSLIEETIR